MVNVKKFSPESASEAAKLLEDGAAVVFPTETVYGLGVRADYKQSIENLYMIKERDGVKAITLMLPSIDTVEKYVTITESKRKQIMEELLLGNTVVLNRRAGVNIAYLSKNNSIGIRIPKNNEAIILLTMCKFPMAVTSANMSGQPSCTTAKGVYEQIGKRVPLIIESDICHGKPSKVIDLRRGVNKVLRA
ncbi:MAG: L-threonylcarbamoyladenylate synthase [Firmicutes bacterium]|nr:L-threonylcarbamoyladenylate synthase [Bacillota bacterium]